jgi:hypothetical protein
MDSLFQTGTAAVQQSTAAAPPPLPLPARKTPAPAIDPDLEQFELLQTQYPEHLDLHVPSLDELL